ncbi:NAD binding domain of 6-phosphogluconate dehydrogenase/NAD-binding of NADP-dependent 3-hydroxyisobutyrate dehydrogenase, putative [Trypanosoma equiperdum]|uniref:Dehydrogenase-like protein n=2 Tax=Trypanozoon TaxID=39700 RepID=Q57WY0_TRYB2|nr:hypothetical protein, conserved [Trypanosoma brucei brucei TREU927]AAX69888.1 hypothetical protein, conserved [Trypanosoma brucei]AAZ10134.1 hypothetical protein, conserved [Trypanosoma brucei brucei TREU927]SCU69958.1 NAD binding domain of 6-phosphogluconate dehydrogenase/NAD-binding of NADP-dependent 3-hydroxyisobutyrate dehydrogenase, putative [Trypanosoma equiperdum]
MSAIKRSLNVGVVGMGNMGVPIARNLGFKARSAMYLQIHSRALSKAKRVCDDLSVDGATCAMRIHDRYSTMTKWCDVIVLALADVKASRHALLEDNESLIMNARKGQIIVDHTTVDAETSRECAHEAARRGAYFLDAPMSGSPRACFNGQLLLMVGGDAETFQKMLPIFHMYADNVFHMGESGSGTAAKMISQALVASHNAAAAEALSMAHALGIEDQSKLVQVLDASWGSSTMLRRNAPLLQDLIRNPDKTPPTSAVSVDRLLSDLAHLDASLPKRGGEDEPFPVFDAALRSLAAASDAGMGDRDLASVVHYIEAGEAELRNRTRVPLGGEHLTGRTAATEANSSVNETPSTVNGSSEVPNEFGVEDFY